MTAERPRGTHSVLPGLQGVVKDVHGVVSGAAARERLARDHTWVSQRAEVHPVSLVVVLPEELTEHLRWNDTSVKSLVINAT